MTSYKSCAKIVYTKEVYMNISNNISSLSANQTFLNTSASNVANVSTQSGNSSSQTDLAKEIPDQIIAQNVAGANVSAVRTEDEMIGSLLDIKA